MPFILQFYLIYPLILSATLRFGAIFLLLLALASLIIEWAFQITLVRQGLNINFMFVGHLPVFCAGIYFALKPRSIIPYWAAAVVLFVFIWGCYNATMWLVADLSMVVMLLVVLDWFFGRMSVTGLAYRVTAFFGLISFHLFMVNGFLRSPFHDLAVSQDTWWFTIICGISSLLFSSAFAIVLRKTDQALRYQVSHWKVICARNS